MLWLQLGALGTLLTWSGCCEAWRGRHSCTEYSRPVVRYGDDGVPSAVGFTTQGRPRVVSLEPERFVARRNPPVYVLQGNDTMMIERELGPIDLFKDGDSLVALQRGLGQGKLHMDGILVEDKSRVYVRHLEPSNDTLHEGLHVIGPIQDEAIHSADYALALEDVEKALEKRGHGGRVNAVVDVLVVVDNAIYRAEMRERGGDARGAMADIRRYYTLMVAMIDARYRAIPDRSISISVRLAGVMIATHRLDAPWSEYQAMRNPDDPAELIIQPNEALNEFHEWLLGEQSKGTLPDYDHAMAFTGYGLFNVKLGGRTSGMAYIASVCNTKEAWSISLVEELGGFANIGTATHELGHSLGAFHDGFGESSDCSADDNYIMTPTNVGDPSVLTNFFIFSRCSIRSFKKVMSSPQGRCLQKSALPPSDATTKLLGDSFGPGNQCRDIFGPQSGKCKMSDMPQNICLRLWCHKPGTEDGCLTTGTLHAIYGTPCGPDMYCMFGSCKSRSQFYSSAPVVKSHRVSSHRRCSGDTNQYYCDQMVGRQPSACAEPSVKAYCCHSCAAWV